MRLHRYLPPFLAVAILAACSEPASEPNPEFTPPQVTSESGQRIVLNSSPRAFLRARSGVAPQPAVLFSASLAAAHRGDGLQGVLSPEGDRLIILDGRGEFQAILGIEVLQRGIAVTPDIATQLTGPLWLVVERDGAVHRLGPDVPPGNAFEAPFDPGVIVRLNDRFIGARSPFALSVHDHEPEAGPLLVELDWRGRIVAQIDTATTAGTYTEAALNNSGFLASNDSLVFFASRSSSDVRAYDREGRLRWISRRTGTVGGYANAGIAAYADRLWVLGRDESGGASARVFALAADNGVLEASGEVPVGAQLITLDRHGAIWSTAADQFARLAPESPRPEVADFTLPLMEGGSFTLSALRGQVVLLNVWASWCGPCRDEFPILDRLAAEMAERGVAIVGVNEDVDERAARSFAAEFQPRFAIPMGAGRMQRALGYRGLPYTLLLDRDGKIAARFFGFAGEAGYRQMRDAIERELAAGTGS